jgi:RPA family protein
MPPRRITAIRAMISDVENGTYGKTNGPHVVTNDGVELRRVVLVGTVSKDPFHKEGFSSITISDGTGTIRIKAWKSDTIILKDVTLGSMIMIIGKIRKYQDELYIIPEIVQEVSDSHYMELHLLHRYHIMTKLSGKTPEIPHRLTENQDAAIQTSIDESKNLHEQIFDYIRRGSKDGGVPIRNIAEFFKARGHSTAEIHLEVIKLQEMEKIMEIQIGLYAPSSQIVKAF